MPLPPGPLAGTCGFAYPEWRRRFYPPDLSPREQLAFYAEVFNTLELDSTFYRPPDQAVVERWAAALPDVFAVAAKVPRDITHELRLAGDAAAAMLGAFARALDPLGDRLLAALLQLPPSLSAGEGRDPLARLLAARPATLPVVVEPRHLSWDADWLPGLLDDLGVSLAVAERPGWPALEPHGPLCYVRLLGDRRETPEIGIQVRDRGDALDRWAARLLAAQAAGNFAVGFANNRFEGAGFATAAALRARLGKHGPDHRDLWPRPTLPGVDWS